MLQLPIDLNPVKAGQDYLDNWQAAWLIRVRSEQGYQPREIGEALSEMGTYMHQDLFLSSQGSIGS